MQRGDGYVVAQAEELERAGNWTLVRRSLDCKAFGVNLVEIPPGESIPEHDETGRDQEELFSVIAGSAMFPRDRVIHSLQKYVEVDEPEPEAVPVIAGAGGNVEADDTQVTADRMTEEELLKGLEGLAPPEERPESVEPDDDE